jgi:hypothetical protein
MVTVAPGSAAPVSSVTFPSSEPYSAWEPAGAAIANTSAVRRTPLHANLIFPPKNR